MPNVALVPPLDVQVAWFTHMLQSDKYPAFIARSFPKLTGVPHVAVRRLSTERLQEGEKKAKV